MSWSPLMYNVLRDEKMLDVSLLGTGGMMPMPGRFLASMLLRLNGGMLLVDCGEGTQVTLKILGWGFKSIDCICFTHYHADHISGLPGMLLTIGNSGRTERLTLMGPPGLKTVVEGLRRIVPELPFDIEYVELSGGESLRVGEYNIRTLSVHHRIKCLAYRFDIKRAGRFSVEKAESLGLPKPLWSKLQKEGHAVYNGREYTGDMVLGEERRGISLSYCTDSRPGKDISAFVKDSDLFVCEGMYGEDEKMKKAEEYRHMIYSEAAALAKEGNVKKLWLTHFSPSLSDPYFYVDNARRIFPNTEIGRDRMCASLGFAEEE